MQNDEHDESEHGCRAAGRGDLSCQRRVPRGFIQRTQRRAEPDPFRREPVGLPGRNGLSDRPGRIGQEFASENAVRRAAVAGRVRQRRRFRPAPDPAQGRALSAPPHGHRVSGLPPADGPQRLYEPALRAQGHRLAQRIADPQQDRRGARHGQSPQQGVQDALRALGRRTAASGHCAGAAQRPAGDPGRRTDRQPRPCRRRRADATAPMDRVARLRRTDVHSQHQQHPAISVPHATVQSGPRRGDRHAVDSWHLAKKSLSLLELFRAVGRNGRAVFSEPSRGHAVHCISTF